MYSDDTNNAIRTYGQDTLIQELSFTDIFTDIFIDIFTDIFIRFFCFPLQTDVLRSNTVGTSQAILYNQTCMYVNDGL